MEINLKIETSLSLETYELEISKLIKIRPELENNLN